MDIRTVKVDENRKSLSVFNLHASAILYMKEGNTVAVENGIPVYPKGNVSLTARDDGKSVTESWSMISSAADTKIVVFEGQ